MYTLQLGEHLFTDISDGDIFVYRYSTNKVEIKTVENGSKPPLNEFTVEIFAFGARRHFIFKRSGPAYWWQEVNFTE